MTELRRTRVGPLAKTFGLLIIGFAIGAGSSVAYCSYLWSRSVTNLNLARYFEVRGGRVWFSHETNMKGDPIPPFLDQDGKWIGHETGTVARVKKWLWISDIVNVDFRPMNNVKLVDYERLLSFPSIKQVSLHESADDRVLDILRGLPELKYVDAMSTQVTSAGISRLKDEFPSIEIGGEMFIEMNTFHKELLDALGPEFFEERSRSPWRGDTDN